MSKKNKNQIKINISGVSTSNILNWEFEDLNRLTNKNLKVVTSRLVSSANKRLRRIEKANITYTSKESKKARKKTQTRITPRKEMRTGPSFYFFYLRQPTTL